MNKFLSSWRLFAILTLVISIGVLLGILTGVPTTIDGMHAIAANAVRWSIPPFVAAFAASPIAKLWPSKTGRWLLANRRYLGLAFAVGMGLHLLILAWLGFAQPKYFTENFVNWRTAVLGGVPYVVLALMAITSFRRYARHVSRATWRRLHKAGMYIFSTIIVVAYIQYLLEGKDGPNLYRFLILCALLCIWGLRFAAWRRHRVTVPARAPDFRG